MALSDDQARLILELDFSPKIHARYAYLARQSNRGKLTKEEKDELDILLDANDLLSILSAQARAFLKNRGTDGQSPNGA